jgi:hypothetical protein
MAERLLLLEAAGSEVQPANLHKANFLTGPCLRSLV